MATSKPWWEVVYSTITGGGRSAYVTGHGIEIVQAADAGAALRQVQAEHPGAEGTVNGPYPTRAAAQAQAKADTSAQSRGTETGSGATGTSNNPKTNIDPLGGIFGTLEAFFGALTDGKMWRSVGWILLGILLMVLGVMLWIGPSAARRSPLGAAASAAKQVGLCRRVRPGTGRRPTSARQPWRHRNGWHRHRNQRRRRPPAVP